MSRLAHFALLPSLALLAGLFLVPEPASAATEAACESSAANQLRALGVDPKTIQSISVVSTRRRGLGEQRSRFGETTFGRNQAAGQRSGAVVRLSSCTGTVFMAMDEACNVRQVRPEGDCKVPGLPAQEDDEPGWWPFKTSAD